MGPVDGLLTGGKAVPSVENEIQLFRVGLPTGPTTGLGLAFTQFDAAVSPPPAAEKRVTGRRR